MNPLARLARRGQRSAVDPSVRLGGAEVEPGALTTLVRDPDPGPPVIDDLLAADRFTVDLDEWDVDPATTTAEPAPPEAQDRTTPWRLLGRLLLVVAVSLLAFHHSVASLARTVASGSVLAYVVAVPLLAGLASAASNRRPGFQVASGVRLRDVVLGSSVCLTALGLTTLLGPGLSGVYGLWRADLLMLWLFLLGATVLCFGLRQVVRSWPFWAVLVLLWPFPVRAANAAVGGATGGAVLLVLVVLAVAAYGHRASDPPRWRVLGTAAVAAAVVVLLGGLTAQPGRLLWPGVVAAAVVVAWWAGRAHAQPAEPVPERRVRGTGPILVGLALLGIVALPPAPRSVPPSAPSAITALSLGPVVVPGFTTTATTVSRDQQHYFGKSSTWQRISLRQGDPATGPAPDGRELVVDVLSTPRPQVLDLYPVVTTYPMGTLSSTPDAVVDLGHGVGGQLFRAEDARRGIAYTLLTFSWRLPVDVSITGGYTGPPAQLTQRITLIAVDDHRPGAPFPEPGNATLDGIGAAVTSIGTPHEVRQATSLRADEQLLDDTARALVHQRLTGG